MFGIKHRLSNKGEVNESTPKEEKKSDFEIFEECYAKIYSKFDDDDVFDVSIYVDNGNVIEMKDVNKKSVVWALTNNAMDTHNAFIFNLDYGNKSTFIDFSRVIHVTIYNKGEENEEDN